MKYLSAALLAFSITLSGTAKAQQAVVNDSVKAQDQAADESAIKQVMSDFHESVASHDGTRLATLFIPDGSTWFDVLSDKAFLRAKLKKPTVSKVKHSSFADFAKFVSAVPAALDPQHTHVQISTDGTIATVYFDYVFLIGGKAQNQGAETWQLIKAENGWKIVAITYSSNPS